MEHSEESISFLLKQYCCSGSSLLAHEVLPLTAWHVALPELWRHARGKQAWRVMCRVPVERVTAEELMKSRLSTGSYSAKKYCTVQGFLWDPIKMCSNLATLSVTPGTNSLGTWLLCCAPPKAVQMPWLLQSCVCVLRARSPQFLV